MFLEEFRQAVKKNRKWKIENGNCSVDMINDTIYGKVKACVL